MMQIQQRRRFMALSDEEKEALKLQFLQELDTEHTKREERARRKRDRKTQTVIHQETHKNREIKQLQSEIRREYYESNGYRLEKDQTGRDMWLSPAEQENRQSRTKNRKKKKRNNKKEEAQKQAIITYGFVILLAIIIGVFITR